jgi:superfamily II DNA or RNA helicase
LELDKLLSYPVKGAWFSNAFRRGKWDGKIHLIRVNKRKGYQFPTGLVPEALRILRNLGVPFKISDRRKAPRQIVPPASWFSERKARPYQDEAFRAPLVGKGLPGIGILRMPIRSGKTMTAALLIRAVWCRTLFVVPSMLLLHQTLDVFRQCFGSKAPIGQIGGGKYEPDAITVATYQSLMAGYKRKNKAVIDTVRKAGLLIVDEVHHLEAEEWRRPLLDCRAYFRVGLSATAYVSRKKPNEANAIWLKACCGPIVYEVGMGYLIRRGWLVPTNVCLHPIESPVVEGKWGSSLYSKLITFNKQRNRVIVECVKRVVAEGKRVLVDIGRVKHGDILCYMLRAADIDCELMIHKTPPDQRQRILRDLRSRRVSVLVSTLLGEGVDVPELEVVINAEGGASRKATIQRLRNMTPSENKTAATIHDFVDLTNEHLARHSQERINAYKAERCFTITVARRGKDKGRDKGGL